MERVVAVVAIVVEVKGRVLAASIGTCRVMQRIREAILRVMMRIVKASVSGIEVCTSPQSR